MSPALALVPEPSHQGCASSTCLACAIERLHHAERESLGTRVDSFDVTLDELRRTYLPHYQEEAQ